MKLSRKHIEMFRKHFAIGIVVILIVSSVALVFYSEEIMNKFTGNGENQKGKQPYFYSEFGNKRITTGKNANRECAIAINPKNPDNIVAVGKDSNTPNGNTWLGYYTSFDGGKTWEEHLIEGYPGSNDVASPLYGYDEAGDPGVDTDKDGNFYVILKTESQREDLQGFKKLTGVFVAKSTDGGKTFPQIGTVTETLNASIVNEKPSLSVDKTTGIVYVSWIVFNFEDFSQVAFAKSTDGGRTFSNYTVLSNLLARKIQVQGVVVRADGNVHVSWIDISAQELRYCYSTNNGQSFSMPVNITKITPLPSPLHGTLRTPTVPTMGIFKGTIYISWNDYKNGDADIFLVSSKDGVTWSSPMRVNKDNLKDGRDQFFPVLASNSEYLQMIFYEGVESANDSLIKVYYSYSKDGENFSEFPISKDINTTMSSTGNDTEAMGDYIGLTCTDTFAIGIWTDTRDGTPGHPDTNLYCGMVKFT